MAFTNKTPSIQEGGTAKNLSCAKLRTAKQSGGTMLWVPEEEVSLGTKSVNKNGTYTAASAGKYGFSQFSVNVRGGNGSADSHGKPTGGDIKPGGAGSAVVGTDPETGNDYAVGVDEDGQLVNTPVPSGIKIVTPPTKTDYVYQEDMDYSGLVVKMINRDGTTFTDVEHPNGHLAVGELVLPVEKAPAGSGDSGTAEAGGITTGLQQPITWCTHIIVTNGVWVNHGWKGQAQCEIAVSGGRIIPLYAGATASTLYAVASDFPTCSVATRTRDWKTNHISDPDLDFPDWSSPLEYQEVQLYPATTINGKTVYSSGNYLVFGGNGYVPEKTTVQPNILGTMDANTAWVVVFGNATGGGFVDIPVKWNNHYTGDTHQDTFQITSTSADGDAHTSTSSNGTEGSGGGGTF